MKKAAAPRSFAWNRLLREGAMLPQMKRTN